MFRLCFALAASALCATALAEEATAPGSGAPGFVPFDPAILGDNYKPQVKLYLDQSMLKLALSAVSETEPDLAELMKSISLIQVQIFSFKDEATKDGQTEKEVKEGERTKSEGSPVAAAADTVKPLFDNLACKGWVTNVQIEEDNEMVRILTKASAEMVQGVAIVVVDKEDVVFVNIAGNMPVESMGKCLGGVMNDFAGEGDNRKFKELLKHFGGIAACRASANPVSSATE